MSAHDPPIPRDERPPVDTDSSGGSRFDRARIAVSSKLAPSDPVRGPRTAVVVGRLLGLAFAVCFATGLFSHFLQDPLPWMRLATRPVTIYQITQGVHVATGLASVPLLLAKLWTVFPRLFTWPPITSRVHLLERTLIGALVSASLIELTIGVMNIYHWYDWPFSFRSTHYALAWVIVGTLLAHIAFQLPKIIEHWRVRPRTTERPTSAPAQSTSSSPRSVPSPAQSASSSPQSVPRLGTVEFDRRLFLTSIFTAAGAIVAFTAGQSTKVFAGINLFGPRRYGEGPQGVPVNRTADAADVLTTAVDPEWRLDVSGPGASRRFTRDELLALPQTEAVIPVACVEGWSTTAWWKGVALREVLSRTGIDPNSRIRVSSLQTRGGYATSEMGPEFTSDDLTLIAFELNGEVLDLDHGYPARIIAPGRPGVLQTKWISSIEVIL